jgi:hypothetical protein
MKTKKIMENIKGKEFVPYICPDSFYKVHVNKRYKLKGWNFQELGEIIGIKFDWMYDEYHADIIRKEWWDKISFRNKFHEENVAKITEYTKRYIALVIKQDNSYMTPLWKALLKIKHDEEFLKAVMANLEMLWT